MNAAIFATAFALLATLTPQSAEAQSCNGRSLSPGGSICPSESFQTVSDSVSPSTGTYYSFSATAGATYTFTFCSPGGSDYDPWLCSYDGDWTLITQNDDYCGLQSEISFTATNSGTHYVAVSGYSSSSGSYTMAYAGSMGGEGGDGSGEVEGDSEGDAGTGETAGWSSGEDGDGSGEVEGDSEGDAGTGEPAGWSGGEDGDGSGESGGGGEGNPGTGEPAGWSASGNGNGGGGGITCNGRSLSPAGSISASGSYQTVAGSVTSSTGIYYAVNVSASGTHTFTFCSPGNSDYDPWLCLYDASWTLVTQNDDYCGLQSHVSASLSTGATYYIAVSGYASSAGGYTLAYLGPGTHAVSAPNTPSGDTLIQAGASHPYATSGGSCSEGHSLSYRFIWGDGTATSFGSSSASHAWFSGGASPVTAQLQCSGGLTSGSSGALAVDIVPATLADTEPPYTGNAASTIDADVTHVSRSPRIAYDASPNVPVAGQTVTWTAHVRSRGASATGPFAYTWYVDHVAVATGTAPSIPAGNSSTVSYSWTWDNGDHEIAFFADPNNRTVERSEKNNLRIVESRALMIGLWVEQSVRDYFDENQYSYQATFGLGDEANSWEDWAQRQMRAWNNYLATAVYPATPMGCLDRVRLDQVLVVADGSLPLNGGLPSNHPDSSDKTVDMMWGFPVSTLTTAWYETTSATSPFNLEPTLVHELNHARYLVDSYGLDVAGKQIDVRNDDGTRIFPDDDSMVRGSSNGESMMGAGGRPYSEWEAAGLNIYARLRPLAGWANYNAHGGVGVHLGNRMPAETVLRFLGANGQPLAGAQVFVYRADVWVGTPHAYAKYIDDVADVVGTTDSLGRFSLGANPFTPSEPIRGDNFFLCVNFIRVKRDGAIANAWLDLAQVQVRYFGGITGTAVIDVPTNIPTSPLPQVTTVPLAPTGLSPDGWTQVSANPVMLSWNAATGTGVDLYEVRAYRYDPSGNAQWVNVGTTSSTSIAFYPPVAENYGWWVRAHNSEGWGSWSNQAAFHWQ